MTNPDLLGDRREQPVPGPDHATPDAVPELPQAASLAPGAAPGQTPGDYSTPPMPAPQVPPPEAVAKRRWYLRAWFIVPATLVVVAATALSVLFALPKTITVRGRVVDQTRPDLAVAAATVTADGKTITTGATGAFTMPDVPQDAALQVTAPAYAARTVSASTQQMAISLIPIPVRVTVTSAMTGAPLTAAISAAPGAPVPYTIASDGTARLYRAAPGETLTVAARGYRLARAAVAADQTLAVALEPTVPTVWQQITNWASRGQYTKIVDWVLRPAIGYTFIPPTAPEQGQLNKLLDPQYELYYTQRDIAGTDAWVEITIDKTGGSLDLRATAHAYLGHVTMTTIAGQPAWHGGPGSHGSYGTLGNPGVIDLEVYGDSIAQTDRIMSDILQPLSGNSQTTAA